MRTLIGLAGACAAFVPRTPALRRRTARDAMLPDVALSIADGSLATSAAVAVGTGAATLGTLLLEAGRESGCTEWVVVLATLLGDADLLWDLLSGDQDLFSAFVDTVGGDDAELAAFRPLAAALGARSQGVAAW